MLVTQRFPTSETYNFSLSKKKRNKKHAAQENNGNFVGSFIKQHDVGKICGEKEGVARVRSHTCALEIEANDCKR